MASGGEFGSTTSANFCLDTPNVPGCTDPTATNYNPQATEDDGSCIAAVAGCTDENACNYDASAVVDDGSCEYAAKNRDCAGTCVPGFDCKGVCGGGATVDLCGVCGGDNKGCTRCMDKAACCNNRLQTGRAALELLQRLAKCCE